MWRLEIVAETANDPLPYYPLPFPLSDTEPPELSLQHPSYRLLPPEQSGVAVWPSSCNATCVEVVFAISTFYPLTWLDVCSCLYLFFRRLALKCGHVIQPGSRKWEDGWGWKSNKTDGTWAPGCLQGVGCLQAMLGSPRPRDWCVQKKETRPMAWLDLCTF